MTQAGFNRKHLIRCIAHGLLLGALSTASTGIPSPSRDLFTGGEGGYVLYRIPALVTTPQGNLLAAVEARRNTGSDWDQIDILFRKSTDGGRTWDAAQPLVGQADLPADITRNPANKNGHPPSPGYTINNPTWVAAPKDDRTIFLYCAEYMRCFVMVSADGGVTFSKPREITRAFEAFRTRDDYAWKVIATGPGHGVQAQSGRIIVPVWLSTSKGGNAHRPSVCATIYSDDGGGNWHAGEIVAGRDDGVITPSETAVVETGAGHIVLNIRNQSPRHRRAVAWSADGATGWSKPGFQEALWEPICMASLVRMPGDRIAFSNPVSLDPIPQRPDSPNRVRHNLGIRISRDWGENWSDPWIVTNGPSAYSDLAVAPDGELLCLYENGVNSPYEKVSVLRVSPSQLLEPESR